MSWFVYIVQCSDNSYYTGITNNLEERVVEHNKGKGAKYTRVRRPVKLIYFEPLPDKSQARKREIRIKDFSRIRKEELIRKVSVAFIPPASPTG